MKRIIASLAITLTISFGTTVEEGIDALNKKDFKAALKIFEKLALKNDAKAQNALGIMYFNGNNAVKRDPIKAKEWFEKAAAQNFASAQHELGVMYAKGEGIKQDKKVAKEWFRKACDNKVQKSCRIYKRLNEQGY